MYVRRIKANSLEWKLDAKFCSWDAVYTRELHNHEEDGDDEGTVWFSESHAEDAILQQLDKLAEGGLLFRGSGYDVRKLPSGYNGGCETERLPSRFLDLGTGNGHMLFALRETNKDGEIWHGEMVGVDYSETSIDLARRIAAQRHDRDAAASSSLRFETWDLLESHPEDWMEGGFDVVLDKGTFDAISLMDHNNSSRNPCEMYRDNVVLLVKPGSFLFVTSCNWTGGELVEWLALDDGELQYHTEAKYPTFTFGGHTGQSIVTIVFRRKNGWPTRMET